MNRLRLARMGATARLASVARDVWELLTRSERRRALALLGLMLASMAFETIGIGLVVPAIALLSGAKPGLTLSTARRTLDRIGDLGSHTSIATGLAALAAIYLLKAVVLALLAWRENSFAFGVQSRLSRQLFAVYLAQPYTFHLRRNSAQLIRSVITSVEVFGAYAVTGGMVLVAEGLVPLGGCILLLIIEPFGALVGFAGLAVVGWGANQLITERLHSAGIAHEHHEALRLQHLQQGLAGAKEAKLLGRESELVRRYAVDALESDRAGRLLNTLQQFPRIALELIGVLAILAVVGALLARGRPPATILATLGLFAAAAFRLIPSTGRILSALQTVRYAAPAVASLRAEMAAAPATAPAPPRASPSPRPTFRESIELRGVTYTFCEAAPNVKSRFAVFVAGGMTRFAWRAR